MASTSPVDQNALWNGPGGQIWVAQQAILDGLFQPTGENKEEYQRYLSENPVEKPGDGN